MVKYFKNGLLMIILLLASLSIMAQDFRYKTGYFGFFDNREYFNNYTEGHTLFGSRVYGEVGYSFNQGNHIMTGLDYLYEFGSKGELTTPDFTAYYEGRFKKLQLIFGSFPRVGKISLPLVLMTDTFQYYRPNTEGLLIEFKTPGFRQNVWIDWTGRPSATRREAFLLGFSGYARKGIFNWEHHFIMSHLAYSLQDSITESLRDNAGYSFTPGLHLGPVTGLDSLTISFGVLGSYDRMRGLTDLTFYKGWTGQLVAIYKGFGIHGTYYAGEPQIITSGDGFYKSGRYGRIDAFYHWQSQNIQGNIQWSFHFLPGLMDLSMSFLLRANIEGLFRRYHSS